MIKKYCKHDWDRLIPEWKASGLSVYSFCRSKGIQDSSMYAALKRRTTSPVFVPVSVTQEKAASAIPGLCGTITVSVGSATITVDSGFNPDLFRLVYQTLRDVC